MNTHSHTHTHTHTQYAPEIVPENAAFVHHIIVYQCGGLVDVAEGTSGPCSGSVEVESLAECRSGLTIAGWAVGGGVSQSTLNNLHGCHNYHCFMINTYMHPHNRRNFCILKVWDYKSAVVKAMDSLL